MRSLLLRVAALCLVILGLSHCGPDTVAVLVRVKNLPPGIAALASTVHLDCKPAQQSAEFTEKLDQLAVTVPKNAIVDGHLVIEVSALDSDRCEVSRGRIDTTIRPDNSYSEVEVSLVPLSKPLCTLTVEQTGSGSITPTPGGVVHGPAADPVCGFPSPADCSFPGACDFLKGQPVTLTSSRSGGGWFVTDWGDVKPGQSYAASGSYTLTLTQPTKVRARLSDGFCSPDSWCWSNPVPQGNFIDGIWGSDASHVWAVGQGGTIVKWNGTTWNLQNSGTVQDLYSVGGTTDGSVWAGGGGGTILKWNGTAWSAQSRGTADNLFGVWGADERNVWAVGAGAGGTILKWNGSSWAAQDSGTPQGLGSVWGTDVNNVWAVGGASTIHKWNGTKWSLQDSTPPLVALNGVWGASSSNIWAIGDSDGNSGQMRNWNGFTWKPQSSGTAEYLRGVWGTAEDNVWAIGEGGTILNWNGSVWKAQSSGTSEKLLGVWGTDAGNAWAVSIAGTIIRWNGVAWAKQESGITSSLNGLWGIDVNNIWSVGAGGIILKWNGTAWSPQSSGTAQQLKHVWGTDARNVWAVGAGGTILHYLPN